VEGGLKVRLQGFDGWACETTGLDRPDQHDYESGKVARFDGEPDGGQTDGLQGCYMEFVDGYLSGGIVTWTGSGMFAASRREICVEMSGSTGTWCCKMKDGYSSTNVGVQIEDCVMKTEE